MRSCNPGDEWCHSKCEKPSHGTWCYQLVFILLLKSPCSSSLVDKFFSVAFYSIYLQWSKIKTDIQAFSNQMSSRTLWCCQWGFSGTNETHCNRQPAACCCAGPKVVTLCTGSHKEKCTIALKFFVRDWAAVEPIRSSRIGKAEDTLFTLVAGFVLCARGVGPNRSWRRSMLPLGKDKSALDNVKYARGEGQYHPCPEWQVLMSTMSVANVYCGGTPYANRGSQRSLHYSQSIFHDLL